MAADASMNYLYTFGGYATLIGVGYALYRVSTHKANRRAAPSATRGGKAPLHQEPRKEDRKKKQRMENFASETQQAAKAKAREKPVDEPNSHTKKAARVTSDDDDDNREFARQLAKAQEGTKLASKTEGAKQREKSVKQSRANQVSAKAVADKAATAEAAVADKAAADDAAVAAEEGPDVAKAAAVADEASAPSSTAGIDADDDQSPPPSPPAGPRDVSGVSDMLEPAPAPPSVLRITDSGNAQKPNKQKVVKAAEKVETKKQRQNRKKAEAAKAAREAAEKERKVLEERQRRTARVAEGRPAKDGSQSTAGNGARSVWTQGPTNGGGSVSEAPALHGPLDTFEKPAPKQSPPTVKSDSSWISSLPSEEEQMEMLKDEADEWSTVKAKSSKKAVKKASSVSSADEVAPTRPKQVAAATGAVKPSKPAAPSHFGGSFSALTTGDDEVDEVEEEWDV
ncbi:hypothetical protein L249_6792 [Ophiocordyceps polyrhachis-furcata BCC 54312]|uniref:Uncharacterized protein n=1 Tax=Ophiocordyceps polyrhachis-furcata BCC 54312 TaxID=1330021 RepID=A0A367LL46_9HYPO|nr:hypothetical protein L249_6792 [Ophiocordyceps polyrhachis-furcata BCC 54312]